jgi:hypothetical protein
MVARTGCPADSIGAPVADLGTGLDMPYLQHLRFQRRHVRKPLFRRLRVRFNVGINAVQANTQPIDIHWNIRPHGLRTRRGLIEPAALLFVLNNTSGN